MEIFPLLWDTFLMHWTTWKWSRIVSPTRFGVYACALKFRPLNFSNMISPQIRTGKKWLWQPAVAVCCSTHGESWIPLRNGWPKGMFILWNGFLANPSLCSCFFPLYHGFKPILNAISSLMFHSFPDSSHPPGGSDLRRSSGVRHRGRGPAGRRPPCARWGNRPPRCRPRPVGGEGDQMG